MSAISYKVPHLQDKKRADITLAAMTGLSRSVIKTLMEKEQVVLDGRPVKPRELMRAGDVIIVNVATGVVSQLPDMEVVYEDDDMLVINKPAGAVSYRVSHFDTTPSVADFAQGRGITCGLPGRPGIVHRLDKNTSGLMMIAKTPKSYVYLQKLLKDHHINKCYTALVCGVPESPEADIRVPIGSRRARGMLLRAADSGGKPAFSHYRTIKTYAKYALLNVKISTGRTHQIRVHLRFIGHPVAGDTIYGKGFVHPPELTGQFLHASGLELTSPSGKLLSLESELPDDLKATLDSL